jgi:ABC-type uncharacterized transport system permease subunit
MMPEWFITTISILAATARTATPLIFCAMAGLVSERSGVIDIGLEGKMLSAAFAAAAVSALAGPFQGFAPWDGLAAAILVAVLMSLLHGVLCGFAGAFHSIAQNAGFQRDMTAGKGFIALAAMIFGKWRPLPALLACLLFGFLDAASSRLQGVPVFGVQIPVQIFQALPYVLTVVLLAGFIGKAIPPRAIGRPYVKER